jgi:deoxycytidine triphosphate deaminase
MRSLSGGSLAREALMHYTRAIELGFRGSRETAHLFEE